MFGKLAPQSAVQQNNANALNPLLEHTVQAATAGDIGERALANIAYGLAQSGRGQQLSALFVALARLAVRMA